MFGVIIFDGFMLGKLSMWFNLKVFVVILYKECKENVNFCYIIMLYRV